MQRDELLRIARHEADFFGGRPSVRRFYDDGASSFVDIVVFSGGMSSDELVVATIGMAAFDNHVVSGGIRVGVELASVARPRDLEVFQHALASAAFNVASGNFTAMPNMIMPDVIGQYDPNTSMKHLLLGNPAFDEGQIGELVLRGMTVAWLGVTPVSDTELDFARSEGVESLVERLENTRVIRSDLGRDSVI